MKDIKVLGPGCQKCEKLAQSTKQAAEDLGIDYTLDKITDIEEIMKQGVMMTPALIVDGEVKLMGKTASINAIKKMLA
jgi:small redox-active disulfide protein 2